MKGRILTLILIFIIVIGTMPLTGFALPSGVPSDIPAPAISNLQLLKNDDGAPFFRMEVSIPQSVLTLDSQRPTDGWVNLEISGKIDNEEWGSTGGGGGHLDAFVENPVPEKSGVYFVDFELEDEGSLTETVIKSRIYTYKLRFSYTYYYGEGPGEFDDVFSPWSNELASKSGSFYKGASAWAISELDRALKYGLITDRIKDNMSGKITREEFAEIAVKLYEKYTGKTALPGKASFSDTTNIEIYKAANLGLIEGIGNNKYAPYELVTREQMATVLLRALKVINPTADFSTMGAAAFADDNLIEAWAKDGVYYCAKAGIIQGIGSNMFDPDGNATREAAVIVCTRAYEFYKK